MKKIIILLLLLSVAATPSYALNIWDRIRYKEVRLAGSAQNNVLVDRLTGEVAYIMVFKRWQVPTDDQKAQLQHSYDMMCAK